MPGKMLELIFTLPKTMLIDFAYLFKKYGIKSKGVLHLGAHLAEESEAYFKQGIQEVIWVEADPNLIPRLEEHVRDFAQMRSTVLCACVSDVNDQVVQFNIANNGGQSSSFLEFALHTKEHPSVRFIDSQTMITTRVDALLKRHDLQVGPGWFLNADLQGAEMLALRGMGELIDQFDAIYAEVNKKELYKGCPLVEEIDAFLAAKGFVGVCEKYTNHGWGDKAYVRKG